MGQYRNVEWLTQNLNRNYPLKETASRAASVSRRLPNEFIADILLTGTTEGLRYFVSEITLISSTTFEIVISDFNSNPVVQFDVPVNSAKFGQYSPSQKFVEELGGRLVIGDVTEMITLLDTFPMSFSGSASELEPSTLDLTDKDLRVTSVAPLGITPVLRGDVKVEGEDGIEITQNQIGNKLIIGFEDPNIPSLCECPPNFPEIKRINGVDADCDGNFNICAEGSIVIEQRPDGICITSIIDPNEICAIIGASGLPGPPGPPGVGIPGPPGPPGPPLSLECEEECIESALEGICTGDFAKVIICNAVNSQQILGPSLDCFNPAPPNTQALIQLKSPFVEFGFLLQSSVIIKSMQEYLDNIGNYLDGRVAPNIVLCCDETDRTVENVLGECFSDELGLVICPQGTIELADTEAIINDQGLLEYNLCLPILYLGDILNNSLILKPLIAQCFDASKFKIKDEVLGSKITFDPSTLQPDQCLKVDGAELEAVLDQCFDHVDFKIQDRTDPAPNNKKVVFDLSNVPSGVCCELDVSILKQINIEKPVNPNPETGPFTPNPLTDPNPEKITRLDAPGGTITLPPIIDATLGKILRFWKKAGAWILDTTGLDTFSVNGTAGAEPYNILGDDHYIEVIALELGKWAVTSQSVFLGAAISILNDLLNVDVPAPVNGDVLSFNTVSGNWENATLVDRNPFSSDAIKVGSFLAVENSGIYRVDISAGSATTYTMTLPGLTATPGLMDGDVVHATIDSFNPPFFNNSLTVAVAVGSFVKYSFSDIGPEGTSFKFSYCSANNTWYQIGA